VLKEGAEAAHREAKRLGRGLGRVEGEAQGGALFVDRSSEAIEDLDDELIGQLDSMARGLDERALGSEPALGQGMDFLGREGGEALVRA
jgi:hypothetical protein